MAPLLLFLSEEGLQYRHEVLQYDFLNLSSCGKDHVHHVFVLYFSQCICMLCN